MKSLFEKSYPNIARWVNEHEGLIEIGYDVNSPLNSFIRIFDLIHSFAYSMRVVCIGKGKTSMKA